MRKLHDEETQDMADRIDELHRQGSARSYVVETIAREFNIGRQRASAVVEAAYDYLGRLG